MFHTVHMKEGQGPPAGPGLQPRLRSLVLCCCLTALHLSRTRGSRRLCPCLLRRCCSLRAQAGARRLYGIESLV